jgi:hypothetical protein
LAKTITVVCPNPECGWVTHVPAEFDDGPSFLSAKEAANRVLESHECGVAAGGESSSAGVTQASEVVKMVPVAKAARGRKRATA